MKVYILVHEGYEEDTYYILGVYLDQEKGQAALQEERNRLSKIKYNRTNVEDIKLLEEEAV